MSARRLLRPRNRTRSCSSIVGVAACPTDATASDDNRSSSSTRDSGSPMTRDLFAGEHPHAARGFADHMIDRRAEHGATWGGGPRLRTQDDEIIRAVFGDLDDRLPSRARLLDLSLNRDFEFSGNGLRL